MNVLFWFRRDLRVHDSPGLTLAASLGRVLPLFVVEPDYWALPDTSARQWEFTAGCLEELRTELATAGAPLVVRVGEGVAILDRICRQHAITRIVSHEETGNLWTYGRDMCVADWARSAGIIWDKVPQPGVSQMGDRRGDRGLGAQAQAIAEGEPLPVPTLRPVSGIEPGQIPSARALRLFDDRCPHAQPGGRSHGLDLLESFLSKRGDIYRNAMASAAISERACSRLSPYLALGALSGREVAQAALLRQSDRRGGRWPGALSSFQSSLTLRDHYRQRFENQPEIETRAQQPTAPASPPRESDYNRLAAWSAGETGLPFVDACMRYLSATGWLNFRMRSMVMAVASRHLGLDWQAAGAVLARRVIDYDPGLHWPQVQVHSGIGEGVSPRICNPVKQGLDQDPFGVFTRRWVPELAAVPDSHLQTPWRWEGAQTLLGHRYPEPIVDVTTAARVARGAALGLGRSDVRTGSAPLTERRHARIPSAQLLLDL